MSSEVFYLIKGLLGLFAVVLVIYHTNQAWTYVVKHGTYGQRWRYFALLGWTVLVTGASVQQLQERAPIQSRNIGALIVIVFTIVSMAISIRESRGRKS